MIHTCWKNYFHPNEKLNKDEKYFLQQKRKLSSDLRSSSSSRNLIPQVTQKTQKVCVELEAGTSEYPAPVVLGLSSP